MNTTEQKTKHTPGPWANDKSGEYNRRWVIRHNGLVVAEIRTSALDRTKDDAPSNARLIAAAPEMLEALQAVADAYQRMFDVMPVAWQTFDDIVQQAIARATGSEA
jgi:hypothetical protein